MRGKRRGGGTKLVNKLVELLADTLVICPTGDLKFLKEQIRFLGVFLPFLIHMAALFSAETILELFFFLFIQFLITSVSFNYRNVN